MTVRAAPMVDVLDVGIYRADSAAKALFSSKTVRALIFGAVLSTGCASPLPQSVSVPVALSCVPADIPSPPQVGSASELAAMGDYELVLRIAAERLDLIAYSRAASAIIDACR